jgi:signal transduction histidine kinase
MSENYSDDDASGAPRGTALARELFGRLVPDADATLLVSALLAERASPARTEAAEPRSESELQPAERELQRLRLRLALGEAARTGRHALNNPLTALLAEAQLLELEPLAAEHRETVGRMVELARRIVAATRRLDAAGAPSIG